MSIPKKGDLIKYNGLEFEVLEVFEDDGYVTIRAEHSPRLEPYEVVA